MPDFEFTIPKPSSMVDPDEYINYLIIERCNEIYNKIIRPDNEYKALQSQFENCFQELLPILQESNHKEIATEKLSGIIGDLEMLLPRLTYWQALKDGLRLKGWVGEE